MAQLHDAEWGAVLPNAVITPHIACNTREAMRRISDITLGNVRKWLSEHGRR